MFYANKKTTSYHPSNSLLHRVSCMYGRGYFNRRKGHIKIWLQRLTNTFKVKFKVTKDTGYGHVMSFDMNILDAPLVLPRRFVNSTEKTIRGRLIFQKGNKLLEITSNCPELETFLISSYGSKKIVSIKG